MRDDTAFLHAIIDNPNDDLPRLVYADYLDEHGDPERAEFIRVQCELARAPADDEPRRKRLWDREWELLGQFRERWAGPLAEFVPRLVYRRGFVEGIALSAAAFLRYADTIWRVAPVLTVQLVDAWEELDGLVASPHLERVRTLSLCVNNLSNGDVHRLVGSPHLAKLERLDLRWNDFHAAAVEAIAASPHLPRLLALDLSGNDVSPGGATALAGSRLLNQLEELFLESANVGPAGVEALAFGDGLPRLATIDLSHNDLGTRGVRALVHGPSAGRWRRIVLRGVTLTAEQKQDLERRFGRAALVLD